MNAIKIIGCVLSGFLVSGCASMDGASGPRGPKLVGSGRATENGQYAEVGVEFSSMGDFTALFSPKRWSSPVATGGSLSWLNPGAWSDDAGRTGRILLGEAVIVGGVAAAAAGGGGGGGGSTSSDGGTGGVGLPGAPPTIPSTPPDL